MNAAVAPWRATRSSVPRALGSAWWLPSIALMLVRLVASRLRFEIAIGLGHALVAAGWPGAASRIYSVEIRRAERQRRAIKGRRGW